MIKTFLFDLGGTVLLEESYDLQCGFNAISKHLAPGLSVLDLLASLDKFQTGSSEFSVLDWIKTNSASESANSAELEWSLWESSVSLKPHDNVKMALDQLRAKGLRMAAVTNAIFSSSCVSRELAKHNLSEYFEFVISSADRRIRKPHPNLFLSALGKIGATPDEAVYIGDNLKADIVGSADVGITPVLFGNKSATVKCVNLNKWSDIQVLLDNLNVTASPTGDRQPINAEGEAS